MLTDTEKAGLVKELSKAIYDAASDDAQAIAYDLLPIIERVIAERDMDGLPDGWFSLRADPRKDGTITVRFDVATPGIMYLSQDDIPSCSGTGTTLTAAIQAAVKAAKEAQG